MAPDVRWHIVQSQFGTHCGEVRWPDADPAAVEAAYSQIMARHVLADLRAINGMSLEQVAELRGVSKAAVHQLENRPLGKVQIASMISYLQAVGYDVDEDWVARSLTAALPARS